MNCPYCQSGRTDDRVVAANLTSAQTHVHNVTMVSDYWYAVRRKKKKNLEKTPDSDSEKSIRSREFQQCSKLIQSDIS